MVQAQCRATRASFLIVFNLSLTPSFSAHHHPFPPTLDSFRLSPHRFFVFIHHLTPLTTFYRFPLLKDRPTSLDNKSRLISFLLNSYTSRPSPSHPIHVALINRTTTPPSSFPFLRSSLINPPLIPRTYLPPTAKVDLITSRAARTRRRARVFNVRARAARNRVSQMCI